MKKNILTSLAILSMLILLGSCANSLFKKGNKEYEYLAYDKAIKHYEKGLSKDFRLAEKIKLANSYRLTNDIENAEKNYEDIINYQNLDAQVYIQYADVLMQQNKYVYAREYLKKYLAINKNDVVAKMMLASCNSISERYRDTTLYKLERINFDQYSNFFSAQEYQNGMVFSADKEVYGGKKKNPWTGNSYLDIYTAQKDSAGKWMKPTTLKGDINGPLHEGPATFNQEGTIVFFTRSNYIKNKKMKLNALSENNLKIFKAELVDGKWKKLEELAFNSDDYSCGHPALSADGKTLYFVSDMPGGLGGTDIYKCTFDGQKWSKPENLGNTINTAGNEMFPYIHKDGTLYFSSDSHNSMGGLDVFMTYYTGERWVQPENLNYPLNTSKDDFSFALNKDNKTGFVSSTRSKEDKVYTFTKNDPTFNLIGFARKKGTQFPVEGVTVKITDASNNAEITMVSGKDGKFKMKLAPEKEYLLLCTKLGCFTRTDKISTKSLKYSEDFYADFEVEEIIIDKPIVLENIYYDFDKWNIREDAAIELDKLVKILNDNPTIDIEMGSHTDSRGSDTYNMVLSDKRAKAAVDYLVFKGIDAKRLTWKGYGESKLVNNCANDIKCSVEEHQKNRRTEFKVTKINK
jgi:peptidoglycan-associated lipoprotein